MGPTTSLSPAPSGVLSLVLSLTLGTIAAPLVVSAHATKPSPTIAPVPPDLADLADLADLVTLVEEAFHLVGELGPDAWPGFDVRAAPVILIDGDAEYLLMRRVAPEGWERAERDALGGPVFARARRLSPGLQATFPAVDGVATVVMGSPAATGLSPAEWTVTFAHELFHVHGARRGLDEKVHSLGIGPRDDPSWHLGYPFPYDDPDVQRAMHVLGYQLFRTASLPDDADASSVRYDASVAHEAAEGLLRLLDLRFDEPRHVAYLRYQTGKEGVARHVEHRIARAAASDAYEPTVAFVELAGADAYAEAWSGRYESMPFMIKHAGHVARDRRELYALGHGFAMVLDRLGADWHEPLLSGDAWLPDLLADAVGRESHGCRPPAP